MKPRYRFKGKFGNGERKIVIEYLEKGQLKTLTLPKAGTLKIVLKEKEIHLEVKDVKNSELREPKVHKKEELF